MVPKPVGPLPSDTHRQDKIVPKFSETVDVDELLNIRGGPFAKYLLIDTPEVLWILQVILNNRIAPSNMQGERHRAN